jgi:hypothetical protein
MYRKKPIEVEAVKNDGTWPPIIAWLDSIGRSTIPFGSTPPVIRDADGTLTVRTVDGNLVKVPVGAYLVQDSKGYFYPCDAEIFEANHEEIK